MTTVTIENNELIISGDLLFAFVPAVLKECQSLLPKQTTWVINLSNINNSDSSGLAFLLAMMRYAKKSNHSIGFKQIPEQLIALAKIAGVSEFIG